MTLKTRWAKSVRHFAKIFRVAGFGWKLYTRVRDLGGDHDAEALFDPTAPVGLVSLNKNAVLGTKPKITSGEGEDYFVTFPITLDAYAAHELLHLLGDREERIMRALWATLGDGPAAEQLKNLHYAAHERFISMVAKIIANLAPSGVE